MKKLNNGLLIKVYKDSIRMGLEEDFILLIEQEINKRISEGKLPRTAYEMKIIV